MKNIAVVLCIVLVMLVGTSCVHHYPYEPDYWFQALGSEGEYVLTANVERLKNGEGTEIIDSSILSNSIASKASRISLSMVADEDMAECRQHFATISSKNPEDVKVQKAQIYLDGFKYWDALNDTALRDKIFVEKIINDKSVILTDLNEVKNYLSSRITDEPYYWLGSTAVQGSLEKLAKSKYDGGGFQTAFTKIDNMDADKVKQYLKNLIKNNMIVGLQIIKDK